MHVFLRVMIGMALLMACAVAAADDPQLSVRVSGGNGPVEVGDIAVVTVVLSDLGSQEAAGFQAFLEFDEMKLLPISAVYTPFPFGLPVLTPIEVGLNTIDLASGIDVINGQSPVTANSVLAVVQFVVLQDSSCVNSIYFRTHNPPTRVTNEVGEEISSLVLIGLGSGGSADLDDSGEVGVPDLLLMLAAWGECEFNEPCPADLDCNGTVGVPDLLIMLAEWG